MADSTNFADLTQNAMSGDEVLDIERKWRFLVWANEGKGKTHAAFTFPEPIVMIDTEGKSSVVASKFTDKQIAIYTPNNYDEAISALNEGMDALDEYREQTGEIGTIVVDSMSVMWTWSQKKHADKYYKSMSFQEAKESFGGWDDWVDIKKYHNQDFRNIMLQSPYHLCWTAMSKTSIDDDDNSVLVPDGEKKNKYIMGNVLNIHPDKNGVPVGRLDKSDIIKNNFDGLRYPTFDKLTTVIDIIDNAERKGDVTVSELKSEIQNQGNDYSGVKTFQGTPWEVSD